MDKTTDKPTGHRATATAIAPGRYAIRCSCGDQGNFEAEHVIAPGQAIAAFQRHLESFALEPPVRFRVHPNVETPRGADTVRKYLKAQAAGSGEV